MSGRIERRFSELKAAGRAGLITFVCAGDPDPATSAAILAGLPAAGADLIEIGMPFSDPMADGPSIQAAGTRALKRGMSLRKTLAMVLFVEWLYHRTGDQVYGTIARRWTRFGWQADSKASSRRSNRRTRWRMSRRSPRPCRATT